MCQFKAKDFELIDYPVCLGNISKDFSVSDIKQTGLKLHMCMIFWLIMEVLMLIIFWIFINT